MTRMHRGALILAAGLALAAAVQAAPNPTLSPEQEAVVRAIRTFYEAAAKDDLALFHPSRLRASTPSTAASGSTATPSWS